MLFDKTLNYINEVLNDVPAIIMRRMANVNMDIFEQRRGINQAVKNMQTGMEQCINNKSLYALDYG